MTPKAQQIGGYDVPENLSLINRKDGKTLHSRNPSTASNSSQPLTNLDESSSSMLYSISSRVTNAISPSIAFLIATSIAVRYPIIHMVMFLTILIGTSPLYFIMITFLGKSNKSLGNPVIRRHKSLLATALLKPGYQRSISCDPSSNHS